MIRKVMDRAIVSDVVAAVKEHVLTGALDEHVVHAARVVDPNVATVHDARRTIVESLPENNLGPELEAEGGEPFMSPDPMVSLLQSSLQARLHEQGLVEPTPVGDVDHGLFSHTLLPAERISRPLRGPSRRGNGQRAIP